MLFNLDKHKLRVALEMAITAMIGGAAMAIVAHVSDPEHFNWFDAAGLKDLGKVALGGAATGLFFLLRQLPRNPAAIQRREDIPQVVKAAEKLGIVGPERLARGRRQADAIRKKIPIEKEKGKDALDY